MLKIKQIKLPLSVKVYFSVIQDQRFIVFNNIQSNVLMSINIPRYLRISKIDNFLCLIECEPGSIKKTSIFYTYLKNFILTFQIPAKKTVVLRGLGLKANLFGSHLSFKLGYSHDNIIDMNIKDNNTVFVGKKFVSISNYNKIFLGNFVEKLYRLKKANCYKGRGLYIKEKTLITKVIKKT